MNIALQSYKRYIHIAITICLMYFIRFVPPVGCITPFGMEIVGIFVGLIYGWTFCGMIWPSLFGMLMLGLSEYGTVNSLLSAGAGHQTVLFIFFLYIFCGVINDSGVTEVIGQYIVSLKIAQGKPFVLAFLMFFGAWLMGALVSSVAAAVLFWQVFSGVCTQLGYQKGEKYPKLVVIGILYSALMGSTVFPFKIYPIIMMGVYTSTTGSMIEFLPYTIVGFVVTMILLLLYTLICKYIIRPEVSNDVAVLEAGSKLNNYQKKILALLFVMMLAFFLPSFLPKQWLLAGLLNGLGNNGIAVAILIMCFLITDNGKPLLDIKSAVHKGMSWDIYFLVMAAFQLANAMTADSTGIKDFIVSSMGAVLGGHSPMMFAFIVIALGTLMSNVISNVVTPMIMIPLLVPFAGDIGVSAAALTVLLSIAMTDSIMLPSGSPMAGLLLANEWVEVKDVYLYGCIILVTTIIICTVVGFPLASMLM